MAKFGLKDQIWSIPCIRYPEDASPSVCEGWDKPNPPKLVHRFWRQNRWTNFGGFGVHRQPWLFKSQSQKPKFPYALAQKWKFSVMKFSFLKKQNSLANFGAIFGDFRAQLDQCAPILVKIAKNGAPISSAPGAWNLPDSEIYRSQNLTRFPAESGHSGQIWPDLSQIWSDPGQIWPDPGQIWPDLVRSWLELSRSWLRSWELQEISLLKFSTSRAPTVVYLTH